MFIYNIFFYLNTWQRYIFFQKKKEWGLIDPHSLTVYIRPGMYRIKSFKFLTCLILSFSFLNILYIAGKLQWHVGTKNYVTEPKKKRRKKKDFVHQLTLAVYCNYEYICWYIGENPSIISKNLCTLIKDNLLLLLLFFWKKGFR